MASSEEYLDCELYLSNYNQAKLSVDGREEEGQPALGENLQQQLRQEILPEKYGQLLFSALLPAGDKLLTCYRKAQSKRLRFRLHIATKAPAELHKLDWELLYDAEEKIALGCSRDTTLSRSMSVGQKPGTPVDVPPKLLIVISNPTDLVTHKLAKIDLEATKQDIATALQPLANLMTYKFLEGPATTGNIRDQLVGDGFHALHIQAHGTIKPGQTAELVLEKENGQADFVEEARFSKIFEGERNLRLITLICCHGGALPTEDPFSGLGLSLVERGIPAVLAMRRKISMKAAALFINHFYLNLARSGLVDVAVNEARWQLHNAEPESREWSIPALFMRLEDGRLFQSADRIARRKKEPETEKLRQALLKLNYDWQENKFQQFVETQRRIGTLLITGANEDCGQRWLINRLVLPQLYETKTTDRVIPLDMKILTKKNDINRLWHDLSIEVGLDWSPDFSEQKLAEEISELLKDQNVFLVINNVGIMYEDYVNKLINGFWRTLVKAAQNHSSRPDKRWLLMFLVDNDDGMNGWQIEAVGEDEALDPQWEPGKPIKLKRLDEKLDVQDIEYWLKREARELPLKFNSKVEFDATVKKILDYSEQGVPMLVLQTICQLCKYKWNEEKSKWMKL